MGPLLRRMLVLYVWHVAGRTASFLLLIKAYGATLEENAGIVCMACCRKNRVHQLPKWVDSGGRERGVSGPHTFSIRSY